MKRSILVLFSLAILGFLIWSAEKFYSHNNGLAHFKQNNVCFNIDDALDRNASIEAIDCVTKKAISPHFQVESGYISFDDIDSDELPEAIFQSSAYECNVGVPPCFAANKVVFKVCAKCKGRVSFYLSELPQLNQKVD